MGTGLLGEQSLNADGGEDDDEQRHLLDVDWMTMC